jgi:hypothetical protein
MRAIVILVPVSRGRRLLLEALGWSNLDRLATVAAVVSRRKLARVMG